MSENEPPTTPATPVAHDGPPTTARSGSRWDRVRPRGRTATVLVGVGGFVLGLLVAGGLLLASPGGPGGPGGPALSPLSHSSV